VEASFASTCPLVSIRYFGASDTAKSLLASGGSIGFLFAPLFLILIGKSNLPVSKICSTLMALTAIFILISATSTSAWFYVIWVLLGCVLAIQVPSLMVHVYSNNYRPNEKGGRISGNLMLSSATGGATALIIGLILDWDLAYFKVIAIGSFLICLGTAYFHLKIPSKPLESDSLGLSQNLIRATRDRLFLWILSGLMLTGIGVMLTIPIRVEYLVNPAYGLNFSNTLVLCITMVVPLVMDVSSTPIWGWAYDKFNLAYVRTSAGIFFLLGLFLFFQSESLPLLCLSSALIGTGVGGGTLVWTLWVIKVAPRGMEACYMSLHLFFTGMKGLPAPFLGYWTLTNLGPGAVSWVSATLIMLGCVIFVMIASDRRLSSNCS
jgi:MFS family permease